MRLQSSIKRIVRHHLWGRTISAAGCLVNPALSRSTGAMAKVPGTAEARSSSGWSKCMRVWQTQFAARPLSASAPSSRFPSASDNTGQVTARHSLAFLTKYAAAVVPTSLAVGDHDLLSDRSRRLDGDNAQW
jgi:hypothetical protein